MYVREVIVSTIATECRERRCTFSYTQKTRELNRESSTPRKVLAFPRLIFMRESDSLLSANMYILVIL